MHAGSFNCKYKHVYTIYLLNTQAVNEENVSDKRRSHNTQNISGVGSSIIDGEGVYLCIFVSSRGDSLQLLAVFSYNR